MTNDATERKGADDAGGRGKQVAASIVTVITLVVIFAVVFPQAADYGEAWDAVTGMPPWAAVGLVLATVVLVLVYPLRYQAALPALGYRPAFSVSQTAFAIGNGLPGGGPIGVAVQLRMLDDHGVKTGPASAALGINSVWNALVLVAMAVVGVVGIVVAGGGDAWAIVVAVAAVVVLAVGVRFLVRLFRDEDVAVRIGRFADRLQQWVAGLRGREPERDLSAELMRFRSSTHDVVAERAVPISATNALPHLMSFAVFLVAVRGTEVDADTQVRFAEAFGAYTLGRLGGFIPLTPGGLATVDALIVGLLVSFGAPQSEALAATLVWRLCTYAPQMIIGIIVYVRWRRRRTRAQRTARRRGRTP